MLLDKMKIEKSKVHLIKNGINLDSINKAIPVEKHDSFNFFVKNSKIIIQISRFQPQKDQQTLIKAMQLLPENVVLWLVGEGELKLESENLSKQLNLEHRIFFLGIRMDVPQLLKTADIVVLSSHYEGLSLASIEGLASGKPFIASNVPGLTEVVQNAGLLFEENNEKELANYINNLLKDENYYNEIAQKCLSKSKEYDINKMVFDEIELYKKLI
jgi:glycosyltransferase involved in cell wall biosynthesis